MQVTREINDAAETAAVPVSFIERFARSQQFDALFREGMTLVETTADYLDGEGRHQAKGLDRAVAVVYATESMRLTTRLLEVASWLVIQRALKDGDITAEEAEVRRDRVKLRTLSRPSHIRRFDELPEGLQTLIKQSFALSDRISQIDRAMADDRSVARTPAENPVASQLKRLATAFSPRH